MKFLALNVGFSNLSLDPLGSRRSAHVAVCSDYLFPAGLTDVKMVADRHRHAALYNKHWRRAS